MKKILFLHGFTSGGRCETVQLLAQELRSYAEIIAPDLPPSPKEAIELVRRLCYKKRPDLIVGISCGAFYAQQVVRFEGIPALLINPFLRMSEFLKPKIGIIKYITLRYDGNQKINITPSLIKEFEELEEQQFNYYDEFNRNRVWGLFGKHDNLAHSFKNLFAQYYSTIKEFDGGHSIETENVINVLAPITKEMLGTILPIKERYFKHFKGKNYKMWHTAFDSETLERKIIYQALYGDRSFWCCAEKMFFEIVEINGKCITQFSEIDKKFTK